MKFLFFVDTESNLPFLVVFTIIYDENILGPACFCFWLAPGLKLTFSMSRRDAPKYWFFSLLIVINVYTTCFIVSYKSLVM